MWSGRSSNKQSQDKKQEETFEDPFAGDAWPEQEEGFDTGDQTPDTDQYGGESYPVTDSNKPLSKPPPTPTQTAAPIDPGLASVPQCLVVGCVSGISGAFLGAFFGTAFGKFETLQNKGLPPLHIRMRSMAGAKDLGGFFAVYNGAHCTAKHLRGGADDAANAGIAGFAVGMFQSLHAKRPPQQAVAAAFTTGLMFMAYDAWTRS